MASEALPAAAISDAAMVNALSFKIEPGSKIPMNLQVMLPPPLSPQPSAASSHSKIISNRLATPETDNSPATPLVPPVFTHVLHARFAFLRRAARSAVSYFSVFRWRKHECFALRNFDTVLPCPYCYGPEPDDLSGERRQRTHRRRFARPPRSLIRAGLKVVGAANALRCTSSFASRNENDSARLPRQATWRLLHSARDFPAKPQRFESVRRFRDRHRCHISRGRPKIHS